MTWQLMWVVFWGLRKSFSFASAGIGPGGEVGGGPGGWAWRWPRRVDLPEHLNMARDYSGIWLKGDWRHDRAHLFMRLRLCGLWLALALVGGPHLFVVGGPPWVMALALQRWGQGTLSLQGEARGGYWGHWGYWGTSGCKREPGVHPMSICVT